MSDGLIEVQDTSVVKVGKKEKKMDAKQQHTEKRGPAKMIRVFLGEADRWHGEPLYEAIVKRLRMMDVCGATVYRGILGYGAKGHTHKQHFLHLSHDLPVMISIVESADRADEIRNTVETMLTDGLIVISDVEMFRLVRSAAGGPDVQS